MIRNLSTLLVALLIATCSFSQNKKLVFVGKVVVDDKDGQTITAITEHGGYDIQTIELGADNPVATEDILPDCNDADVVILGRSIKSDDFGSAMAVWDKITTPTICMNMWGLRNLENKGFWVNNAGCENVGGLDPSATLMGTILIDDPVFDGATGLIEWGTGNHSVFSAEYDGNDQGNGVLLVETIDQRPLFIRWDANVEFFPGANHSPMGPRTYIGVGQDDEAPTTYFNFTDAAKAVFFNELERMANLGGNAVEDVTANTEKLSVLVSNNTISVSLENMNRVEIYTIEGKLALSSSANSNTIKLNSTLQNGIYIAKAYTNSGNVVSEKFSVR